VPANTTNCPAVAFALDLRLVNVSNTWELLPIKAGSVACAMYVQFAKSPLFVNAPLTTRLDKNMLVGLVQSLRIAISFAGNNFAGANVFVPVKVWFAFRKLIFVTPPVTVRLVVSESIG
jgi:hypothetical protein